MKNNPGTNQKKILVVDDDIDILEGLSIILEAHGYSVKTVEKGDHIYQIINDFRPDLILLDVMLSGIDGRDICLSIKHSDSIKDIPIMMISAHPEAKFSTLQNGADAFLAKPFEIEDFLSVVTKFAPL